MYDDALASFRDTRAGHSHKAGHVKSHDAQVGNVEWNTILAAAKNRREHRVYVTELEVSLPREQLLARAPRTSLVFPNPEGRQLGLMAVAGLDPAVASERMGHSDGGALFLKTYRHLYEGEKRVQAGAAGGTCSRALGRWLDNGPWGRGRTA